MGPSIPRLFKFQKKNFSFLLKESSQRKDPRLLEYHKQYRRPY